MLTTDDARQLATKWQPRFSDPQAYVTSVERYLERVPGATRSVDGLERWLATDADQEQVRATLLATDARPESPPQHLPALVDDCATCRGKRWVRRDLPVGHPEFGKALVCPSCNGRPTGQPEAGNRRPPERNLCWKCRRFEDEASGEACTNPRWHAIYAPDAPPVPGNLGEFLK